MNVLYVILSSMKRLFNFDTAAILYEEKDALSKVSLSSGKAVASPTMAALAVENTVWIRPSLVGA